MPCPAVILMTALVNSSVAFELDLRQLCLATLRASPNCCGGAMPKGSAPHTRDLALVPLKTHES